MKYLSLLFVIFFISCSSKSVRKIDFDFREYKFTSEIENLLNKTADGGLAARQYSLISENKKIIESLGLGADTIKPVSETKWKNIQEEYKFTDAVQHIVKEAEKFDFVLVNENHNIPQHRDFVKRLLKDLADIGYTNIALEAMTMTTNGEQHDFKIEERGYPITNTGLYIQEPQFSNLVRTAVQYGYKIIGYDTGSGEDREIQGARNILANTKKKDGTQGKTVVLCGWDHIKEAQTGNYWNFALAGRIKEYTNKDILTVNQTIYYEKSKQIYEDSIYQWVDVEQPMVFLDSAGEAFDVQKNKDWYDLFVFHPRTTYQEGFPNWLSDPLEIVNFKCPAVDLKGPCKIFVFDINDNVQDAIPIYVLEVDKTRKNMRIPQLKNSASKIVLSNGVESYLIE